MPGSGPAPLTDPGCWGPTPPIQPKPRGGRAQPYSTRKKTRAIQRFKQFIVPNLLCPKKGDEKKLRRAAPRPARLLGARPLAGRAEAGRAARPSSSSRAGAARPSVPGNQGDSRCQGREPIGAPPGPFQKSKANKKTLPRGGWAGRRGAGSP